MKRVIKNQKKMKNTMYIVFGTFALALFAITRINPSYANDGLMIDNALDAIALYGEVEVSTDEVVVNESHDEDSQGVEGDEDSQNVFNDEEDVDEDGKNLGGEGVNNGENNENENSDKEGNTEETEKIPEVEEVMSSEEGKISNTNFQGKSDSISTTLSDDWNTAIETVVDGKKAIIYNGKILKINSVSSSSCWNAESNPSEDSVIEAVTMWCHLSDNNCDSSNLRDVKYPDDFFYIGGYGDNEELPNVVTLLSNLDGTSINKMKTFFGTDIWWTSHDFGYEDDGDYWTEGAFLFEIGSNGAYFSYEDSDGEYVTKCWSTQRYTPPKHPHLSFSISTYQTYYTVVYDTQGGNSIPSVQASSVTLPTPTREGYTFKGWCKNATTCGSPISAGTSQTITENTTYYALWAQAYTVTFNTQGGDAIPSQTKESGTSIILPTPTRNGYTFKGWCKNDTTCSSPISAGTSETVTENVTYYAQWEEIYIPTASKYQKIYITGFNGTTPDQLIQTNIQEWDDLELYFLQSDGTTVKHYTIMDRNLGATEVYNQQFVRDSAVINTASFGYHYQWGNNYGFEPCINNPLTNNTCTDFTNNGGSFVSTISRYIWSVYMPSKYARNTWSTAENWMASPSTIDNIWGGSGDDTSKNGDGTLIGNNNDWSILSGRQGPCPEGYYIPSTYDWLTLKNAWGNSTPSASNGTKFTSDLLLPPAGYRDYYKNVRDQGNYGYYSFSSPHVSSADRAYYLYFNSSSISPQSDRYRSIGFTVRCAKSSPNTSTFTLHANGGSKAVIAFTGTVNDGNFTALGTPSRGSDEFAGWYTKDGTNDDWGNKLGVGSGVVTDIYARWSCPEGQIDNGTECTQPKNTVTFNYITNGGTSTTSGSIEVESGATLDLSLYTGTKADREFIGWNTNSGATTAMANPTVTAPMTLYAIFKKEGTTLTGTIIPNGATVTSTKITCDIPTIYNNQPEVTECTLNFPTATRTNGTVYGYSTTNTQTETPAIENGGTTNISASTSFYVISKEILTGTFYLNGNTSQTPNGQSASTAESVTATCTLWNTGTQCNITTPTYVPADGKIAKGYTTVADVSNESNPVFISTGTSISLTTSNSYYAQSKSNDTILHVTYLSGAGVQSIGKDSDSCTLTGTWNSISQAAECAVKAPTITLKAGYKAGIWTTGNITKNPGDDIILTRDDTYTARAINNTDTQYHVNYYKENLDGTYDLFETWTGYGTTDTQAVVTGTDKSYVGFTFSGTNVNNVTSGNIDGDGSRVLSLYYDRVAYKLNYVVDGNIIQSGNVKYEADITVPLNPQKECNEFSGWTSSVAGLTTTGTMPDSDVTFTANWNYTCSKSSGGGGGAKKTETNTREIAIEPVVENEHNSADEKENAETSEIDETVSNDETSNQVISVTQEVSDDGTIEAVVETVKIKNTDIIATVRTEVKSNNSSSTTHTKEEKDAYSFAKSNGITTTESIEAAKMNTKLTRIEMAKMLSNFAINVLKKEPDTSKVIKFDDVSNKLNAKYDNAVILAYQLGIMGQNVKDHKFRPNDEVTRAEFASALSRLLYNTYEGKYRGTGRYYIPHVAKLYNEGIISMTNPEIKEKRGYVMIMLMRTVK